MKLKIVLNPDKTLVNKIKSRLKENSGYCPCSIIQNEDTKCMCKDFRQQTIEGLCHCGLYKKESL